MTSISKSALVPYSPAEMFALVDDIERYPEFLPWCNATQVLARGDDEYVFYFPAASRHIPLRGIAGTFVERWLNVRTGQIKDMPDRTFDGAPPRTVRTRFDRPFEETPALLHLRRKT